MAGSGTAVRLPVALVPTVTPLAWIRKITLPSAAIDDKIDELTLKTFVKVVAVSTESGELNEKPSKPANVITGAGPMPLRFDNVTVYLPVSLLPGTKTFGADTKNTLLLGVGWEGPAATVTGIAEAVLLQRTAIAPKAKLNTNVFMDCPLKGGREDISEDSEIASSLTSPPNRCKHCLETGRWNGTTSVEKRYAGGPFGFLEQVLRHNRRR